MKTILLFCVLLSQYAFAQNINDSINKDEVRKILYYLSDDEMKGRVNFSPEQDTVATYLSNHFSDYGLKPFSGYDSFYHNFRVWGIKDGDSSAELKNVIGMLPGNKYPDEAVIFSAHYDHVKGKEIHNGANDNASGTAAVLMLAKYFAMRKDNERTIVFCLFAGEELGLLGSKLFAKTILPETIKAMINIEMIGVTNRTGKNAFFLTGDTYSNMKKILAKNLEGTEVKLKKEGADPRFLFMRSDNYPFAKLGVPAHTIMCSDDNDPCYHKPCDDVERIDTENMTRIIQAIAIASHSLISGLDTPKRIRL
ncbi:hypothetical protein CAP36_17545 [Chitinophagaceae bacterium IBVUCB2]|nr:hypothetical protein CAP36_17545 [Chitinophagaceae bacterium IBVUCB2]